AHNRDIGDGGMTHQALFDWEGRYLLASAVDQVFFSSNDPQSRAGTPQADIAGVQPAVFPCRSCRVWITQVMVRYTWPSQKNVTRSAIEHSVARLVDQTD